MIAANRANAIGKKLDAAGGFELTLQAHGVFAAGSPRTGLTSNLEMVWDGIGGWRGFAFAVAPMWPAVLRV